ncbi:hypothetical protein DSO57_1001651, partial [Entomophthora muscae]
MKLIVAKSVPPLDAVISLPFGAIISLVWLFLLHGSTFSVSACWGSIPEKCGQAVLQSTGPVARRNPGSGFNSCSRAWVSRDEELSILTRVPARNDVRNFAGKEIIVKLGSPELQIRDGGTEPITTDTNVYLTKNGIKHTIASPYHPQVSVKVEKLNGALVGALSKLSANNPHLWADMLPSALM